MRYKQKKISDLGIYNSLVLLSNELFPQIISLQKDIKISFGYDIIRHIGESLSYVKYAYKSVEEDVKINFLNKLLHNIEMVELSLKFLNDTHYITNKNQARFSHKIGEILVQINAWLKQYKK